MKQARLWLQQVLSSEISFKVLRPNAGDFFLLFGSACPILKEIQLAEADMDISRFEEKLTKELLERGIVGAAWAITDSRELLAAKGFGVTSAEKPWDPVRSDTLFRIASNTKITVTLTAMVLRREGLLDLDAPITDYVPWLCLQDRKAEKRITLRKLLSHTAGFPKEYTPDGVRDEERAEEILRRELEGLPLLWDPDSGNFLYSNLGVRLAALAMSRVSGKPFSELCEKAVLIPLSMEHSTFDLNRACTFSLALPHSEKDQVDHYLPTNAARYAAGGLYSDVEDMSKLARLYLNSGAPLLTESEWEELSHPMAEMGDGRTQYALTLMKRNYDGNILIGHTGSNPPYRSCIWADLERGLGVSFASNTVGGEIFSNEIVPRLFLE